MNTKFGLLNKLSFSSLALKENKKQAGYIEPYKLEHLNDKQNQHIKNIDTNET